MKRLALLVACN